MPNACANDIDNKVIGFMAEFMGRDDVGAFTPDAKLDEDLGIDSLDLAEIMLELEDQFGIVFDLNKDNPVTVGEFIVEIRGLMAGR